MNEEKIKVFTIGDHPLSPSGVGTQTKYVVEALLSTGKYKVVSFGGAIKHQNYEPMKTEEYGDDWVIYPVDGYGTPESVRGVIRNERPDILWFMTDPRFWGWLWEMDHEIRAHMPMVYYHVWDNYPYPKFNKNYYDSNDLVATISKVTDDIVRTVSPDVECIYLPHAVDTEIFKPLSGSESRTFRKTSGLLNAVGDKFVFFWNNRNARRKMSGSIIWWFKEFLDKVGHDKACLIMHTDPHDDHGQDLQAIIQELGITDGEVLFSQEKYPPHELAMIYGLADCTINVSDAEGFGLATLESLACGTPIIVNMTGGLQQQVTDGENWFGVGIEPASKAIIGSQQVPYIYEDRVSKEDFIDALYKMYNMSKKEREELGAKGREYILKEYNFSTFRQKWNAVFDHVHEKHGSWDTRKSYKRWNITEVN